MLVLRGGDLCVFRVAARPKNYLGIARIHAPFEIERVAHIADPSPRELKRYLQSVCAEHRRHRSWFAAEPLEGLLSELQSRPRPAGPPSVPDLPTEMLVRPVRNAYQERLLRAEALAHVRGHGKLLG